MASIFQKALRGAGEGMAKIGEMGVASEFQRMRDERLAKVAEQAADTKFGRDKEIADINASNAKDLAGINAANDRSLAGYKVDQDVRGKKELGDYYLGKGMSADGTAPKDSPWKPVKSADEMGNDVVSGYTNGRDVIDLGTPFGRVVQQFTSAGVTNIDTAIRMAQDEMAAPRINPDPIKENPTPDAKTPGTRTSAEPEKTPAERLSFGRENINQLDIPSIFRRAVDNPNAEKERNARFGM